MKQFWAKIVYNKQIGEDFFEASLTWDAAAAVPAPGQLLTLRVSPDSVPLLRRPFAFAGFDGQAHTAQIIYQKRGRGTEILSAKQSGEKIDVIGPLGNPFPVDDGQEKSIAAAGGTGLGPVLFLAAHLKRRGIETEFVFGCKSESFIPKTALFESAAARICTDDGSAGFAGNVVQYMESGIKPDEKSIVYGCGPVAMLRGLCGLARSRGARAWVSLESVMACGVGACMGCAAPTSRGYLRVCREGPVFDGKDIIWEQM
jgi:dihydroorotate dehydrogenase electron transfer subunit